MECEICGWIHPQAIICEKCGFFLHYHNESNPSITNNRIVQRSDYYVKHTIYPFLNKTIKNEEKKMHMRVQDGKQD